MFSQLGPCVILLADTSAEGAGMMGGDVCQPLMDTLKVTLL